MRINFMNERNVMEILGKNMHDIRFEKNVSLQELAEKTNIDIEILRKFESGEYSEIKIEQYPLIAHVLDVSLQEMTKGIQFIED